MITVILTIVAGGIFGAYRQYKHGYISDALDILLSGILSASLGFVLGIPIAFMLPSDIEIKKTEYKIECLQDNSYQPGAFFIGCGNIDGSMSYVYYYETKSGFKMDIVDYNAATIKYTKSDPKVIKFEEVYSNSYINRFSIYLKDRDKYIFYVPRGTIQNNYNLDAR